MFRFHLCNFWCVFVDRLLSEQNWISTKSHEAALKKRPSWHPSKLQLRKIKVRIRNVDLHLFQFTLRVQTERDQASRKRVTLYTPDISSARIERFQVFKTFAAQS
jgi:hypothetical protein